MERNPGRPADEVRERALAMAKEFGSRMLPTMVQRLGQWKGISPQRCREVLPDLEHELVVDALSHAGELLGLDDRSRNARWFRMLERTVYRWRLRDRGLGDDDQVGEGAAPAAATSERAVDALPLDAQDLDWLRRLEAAGRQLGNGRCNIVGSARALGISQRQMRQFWERVAGRLGFDDHYVQFWQTRLHEALLGFAADLLRATGGLHLLREAWYRPPDPRQRRQRIERIRDQLNIRPLSGTVHHMLRTALRRDLAPVDQARAVLGLLTGWREGSVAVALWQFEAALLRAEFALALRCLRRARARGAAPAAVLLARARLLQVRGRDAAAVALLQRAWQRWPESATLHLARRQLAN